MAPDAAFLAIGADDHRHGVPADDALDLPLDLHEAGIGRLPVGGNRVDIGGRAAQMLRRPQLLRPGTQSCEEGFDAPRPLSLEDTLQRLQPFPVLHLRAVRHRLPGESVHICIRRHATLTRGQTAGSGKGIDMMSKAGRARRAAGASRGHRLRAHPFRQELGTRAPKGRKSHSGAFPQRVTSRWGSPIRHF